MRRGKIAKYLNIQPEAGLSELLNDKASLESCLFNFGMDNLDVIAAGETPNNPAELLGSHKMKDVLTRLKAKYDYIILDAPPAIPLTDPQVLGEIGRASCRERV